MSARYLFTLLGLWVMWYALLAAATLAVTIDRFDEIVTIPFVIIWSNLSFLVGCVIIAAWDRRYDERRRILEAVHDDPNVA